MAITISCKSHDGLFIFSQTFGWQFVLNIYSSSITCFGRAAPITCSTCKRFSFTNHLPSKTVLKTTRKGPQRSPHIAFNMWTTPLGISGEHLKASGLPPRSRQWTSARDASRITDPTTKKVWITGEEKRDYETIPEPQKKTQLTFWKHDNLICNHFPAPLCC